MSGHDFTAMRKAMVASQLRTVGVSDLRVVAAFEDVPREDFVPVASRALAYVDAAVPLGDGRALNPPITTGLMVNAARIATGDRVLVVGNATAYTAAVIARLAADVVETADAAGLPKGTGTFGVILIDGAVEVVPEWLVALLHEGGRMVAALRDGGVTRLATGVKVGGHCPLIPFAECDAVRLPGFERAKSFVF